MAVEALKSAIGPRLTVLARRFGATYTCDLADVRQIPSAWAGRDVSIEGHGNCLSAVAVMHGLALEELTEEELMALDPRYPVLVTIACRK